MSDTPRTDKLLAEFKPSVSDMKPLSQLACVYQALHDTERELAAERLAHDVTIEHGRSVVEQCEKAERDADERGECAKNLARLLQEATAFLSNGAAGHPTMLLDKLLAEAKAALAKNPADLGCCDDYMDCRKPEQACSLRVNAVRDRSDWTSLACPSCHACVNVPPGQPVPTVCFNCGYAKHDSPVTGTAR